MYRFGFREREAQRAVGGEDAQAVDRFVGHDADHVEEAGVGMAAAVVGCGGHGGLSFLMDGHESVGIDRGHGRVVALPRHGLVRGVGGLRGNRKLLLGDVGVDRYLMMVQRHAGYGHHIGRTVVDPEGFPDGCRLIRLLRAFGHVECYVRGIDTLEDIVRHGKRLLPMDGNRFQAGATPKSILFDFFYTAGNRDTRYATALEESILSDPGYAVGDRNTRDALAVLENTPSDLCHGVSVSIPGKAFWDGYVARRLVTVGVGGHARVFGLRVDALKLYCD